jgi:hypothetical protein
MSPSVIVKIQSLKRTNMRGFVQNISEREQKKKDSVLYEENYSGCMNELQTNDAFIGAFLTAYNGHGTIQISPNDIWVIVLMYLSEYINLGNKPNESNPESNESNSDSNESNSDSDSDDSNDSDPNTITLFDLSQKNETLLNENNRTILINLIVNKIRNRLTVPFLADKILSQFTPSKYHSCKDFHKCAAASSTLNVIKTHPIQISRYYSNNLNVPNINGGINNIIFDGIVWDWIKLSDKVQDLQMYDTGDNILSTYIKSVSNILDQFIDSMNGNVDVHFWNTMFQPKQSLRLRSQLVFGSSSHISGWILHFYGIYNSIPYTSLPKRQSNIPINLVCPETHVLKHLIINTGFSGICKLNHDTYAPRLYTRIELIDSIQLTKTPAQQVTCKFEAEDVLLSSEVEFAREIEERNSSNSIESESEPELGLGTRILSFFGF